MAQRKGVREASVKRSSTKRRPITTKFLDAFADAWNRHDVDGLMTFMSDDCVFEASEEWQDCREELVPKEPDGVGSGA